MKYSYPFENTKSGKYPMERDGTASPPQPGTAPTPTPASASPAPHSPWPFVASPGSPSDSVASEAWSDGFAVAGDDTPPRHAQGGGGGSGGVGWGEAAAGG